MTAYRNESHKQEHFRTNAPAPERDTLSALAATLWSEAQDGFRQISRQVHTQTEAAINQFGDAVNSIIQNFEIVQPPQQDAQPMPPEQLSANLAAAVCAHGQGQPWTPAMEAAVQQVQQQVRTMDMLQALQYVDPLRINQTNLCTIGQRIYLIAPGITVSPLQIHQAAQQGEYLPAGVVYLGHPRGAAQE